MQNLIPLLYIVTGVAIFYSGFLAGQESKKELKQDNVTVSQSFNIPDYIPDFLKPKEKQEKQSIEDLKKNEELRSEKELLEQKQLKNERETIFSFAQTEKDNTEKNDASQPQIIIEESEEIEATLQEAQKEQEYGKNSSSDQSELITESHAELNKKNSKPKERVVIKPPVIKSKEATVLKGSIYEIVDLEPEKMAEENKEESSPSHLASSKFVQEEISKALIEIKNKTENHDSPNQSQDKLETQEENTVPKLLEQEKPDLERSREENPSEEPKKVALDQESSAQEISSNEKKVEPEGIIQDTSQKPETETTSQETREVRILSLIKYNFIFLEKKLIILID